jgi:2-polyprenyl-3-methyl-5-hydroxy-6-metoxy-1,4-benzoquinol methylase
LSAKFAKKYPKLIKEISRKNEIAVHCLEHGDKYEKIGDKRSYEKIKEAKIIIEKIIDKKVKGFRAPGFFAPSNLVLKKLKFEYDSSLLPTFIPISRVYTLGKFKNLFKKRRIFNDDKLKIVPTTVMPLIRIPFLWIIFRNFNLTYAKINTLLGFVGTGFINLVMHPWEFSDLNNFDIPLLIKRNTGEKMSNKLDDYIKWCKKNNFKFDTIYSHIKSFENKKIVNRFDKVANDYIINRERGVIGILFKKQRLKLLELLNIKSNERILDAGCGPGTYSLKIKELGGKPYGIDISENMIKEIRNNGINGGVADIQDYKSKVKFDKILVGSSMEFVSDVEDTLKNLKNNLKKNGVLVFDIPHYSLFGMLYYLYYKLKGIKINILSEKQIKKILDGSGFRIKRVEKAGLICFGVKANVLE